MSLRNICTDSLYFMFSAWTMRWQMDCCSPITFPPSLGAAC
ncbi:hypothetical protein [Lysobacter gummosus]